MLEILTIMSDDDRDRPLIRNEDTLRRRAWIDLARASVRSRLKPAELGEAPLCLLGREAEHRVCLEHEQHLVRGQRVVVVVAPRRGRHRHVRLAQVCLHSTTAGAPRASAIAPP